MVFVVYGSRNMIVNMVRSVMRSQSVFCITSLLPWGLISSSSDAFKFVGNCVKKNNNCVALAILKLPKTLHI